MCSSLLLWLLLPLLLWLDGVDGFAASAAAIGLKSSTFSSHHVTVPSQASFGSSSMHVTSFTCSHRPLIPTQAPICGMSTTSLAMGSASAEGKGGDSADNDEDEDDGWGAPPASSTASSDNLRELAALQAERQQPTATPASSSSDGPERDLFIPIFALVSLAGLFGSYGYEMARLYSRGELYLPWEQ